MKVSRTHTVTVALTVQDNETSATVSANGVPLLEFTKEGYLRRLKTNREVTVGFRRLPDGRVAIKPKRRR